MTRSLHPSPLQAQSPMAERPPLTEPLLLGKASAIVFVDTRVTDYQQLVTGIRAGTEVQILDPTQDAIAQITQTLMGRSGLESIEILSHGRSGSLLLGTDWFDVSQLNRNAAQIQSWSSALTEDADILLYGCDVAEGELGRAFVQILSQLTGADVAASEDLTGSSALGGDWTLEFRTGRIETDPVIPTERWHSYQSVLNAPLNDNFAKRMTPA